MPAVAPADAGWGFAPAAMLLRSRVQMLANTAWRGSAERRGWTVAIAVVVCGAMLATYRFAGALFGIGGGALPPAELEHGIGGLLGMLCGFAAVTSVTFALSSLYFARDLDTLLAAPLRPRSVLLARMLTQLGLGAGVGCVLAGPPVLAFLVAHGAVVAAPFVLLLVLALVLLPLVAATSLTVVAVRLLPARHVRDAGGLLVTVVVFAIAAVNVALRGGQAFTAGTPGVLDPGRYAGGWTQAAWSPVGWTARSLMAMLHGDAVSALLWALPVVAAAAALAPLCALLLEGAFVRGYQRNATASRGRMRNRRHAGGGRGPSWTWWVLAAKDAREIRRDPSQLGQLLLPLVLFALYIGRPGGGSGITAGGIPTWYGTALTAAFASLFTASGLSLRGVGSEGPRLWLVRVAPRGTAHLVIAKYLVGFAVSALLGGLLLWVGLLRSGVPLLRVIPPSARLLLVIAGLCGIATGLGAMRPKLDWTDPRRAVSLPVGFGFMAIGACYLCVAFVLLGLPFASRAASTRTVCDVLLVVLAVGAGGGMLLAGGRRLARQEL